jgi:hypothetical protein
MSQAQIDLAHAREKLDSAIGSLTGEGLSGAKINARACCALLQEAAGLLERVPRTACTASGGALLIVLLEQVRERAARVALLLDAAATLWRGRLSAWPSPEMDYTPQGAWAGVSAPTHLRPTHLRVEG